MMIEIICVGHDGKNWTYRGTAWRDGKDATFLQMSRWYPNDFVYVGF